MTNDQFRLHVQQQIDKNRAAREQRKRHQRWLEGMFEQVKATKDELDLDLGVPADHPTEPGVLWIGEERLT